LNSSFAEQRLERRWILQTGDLHDDAVGALPHDRRLTRAEFVNTLADDFDRLGHGIVDRGRNAGVGLVKHDLVAINDIDIDITNAGQARDRLRNLAQCLDCGTNPRRIGNDQT
jgi:hypothetical protein